MKRDFASAKDPGAWPTSPRSPRSVTTSRASNARRDPRARRRPAVRRHRRRAARRARGARSAQRRAAHPPRGRRGREVRARGEAPRGVARRGRAHPRRRAGVLSLRPELLAPGRRRRARTRRGFLALVKLVPFSARHRPPARADALRAEGRSPEALSRDAHEPEPGLHALPGPARALDAALARADALAELDDARRRRALAREGAGPRRDEAIAEGVARSSLLIADGHHRYETALRYAEETEREAGRTPERAEHKWFMVFLANGDDPELVVFPTHRHVHGLAGVRLRSDALARGAPLLRAPPREWRSGGGSAGGASRRRLRAKRGSVDTWCRPAELRRLRSGRGALGPDTEARRRPRHAPDARAAPRRAPPYGRGAPPRGAARGRARHHPGGAGRQDEPLVPARRDRRARQAARGRGATSSSS